MRAYSSLLLPLVFIVACDQPQAMIICHNSNCDGSEGPSADDTMPALLRAFDLTIDNRPAIDGVEVDLIWHSDTNRCLFAHDLGSATDTTADEPADAIAAHLAGNADVAYNGATFYVKIELKSHEGEPTQAQLSAHAGCALAFLDIIAQGASIGGHDLRVLFDAFDPRLIRALTRHAAWPGKDPRQGLELRLSADFGLLPGIVARSLSDWSDVAIDLAEIHPFWTSRAMVHTLRAMNLELTMWMFNATAATLQGIRRIRPEHVLTSDALLVRRWLNR